MHAFDTGAKDFSHIGRIGQDQRQRSPDIRRIIWTRQAKTRDTKADQIDRKDDRHTTENIGESGAKDPQWKERRGFRIPCEGDQKPKNGNRRRTQCEDHHINFESLQQFRKGIGQHSAVEKAALHLFPTRCHWHKDHDCCDDQSGACARNDQRPAALCRFIALAAGHTRRLVIAHFT